MLAAIEWGKIGELLWVAPVAGLAVAVTFSLLILGIARAGDHRRDGSGGGAAAFSALALVAGIAFAAVVIFALEIITTK
ncbi:MAG TPA: hypothetical protein VFT50_12480 [Baekduia sp.]|nr:hypothetical protein [Baekduia sp.]